MKLYKIIPNERRITEVDYDGTYEQMRRHLHYEWFDACRANDEKDYLLVNDVGLLDGTRKKDGCFQLMREHDPITLMGNALYFGTDPYGENANPHATIEQLENLIRWNPHN